MQVDAQDAQLNTALHIASAHGNIVASRALIEHGADANATNKAAQTPLWCAVGSESIFPPVAQAAQVRLLLAHGAAVDVDNTDSSGEHIIAHAVAHAHHDAAALLLRHARSRSPGKELPVPEGAWLAAAEHSAVDSPLLAELPGSHPAAVAALRAAWQRQAEREPDMLAKRPVQMTEAGMKEARPAGASKPATALLQRLAKSALLHASRAARSAFLQDK